MAKVNTKLKASLMDSGRWADFVRRRSDLVLSGKRPAEANEIASAEFSDPSNAVSAPSNAVKASVPASVPASVDDNFGSMLSDFGERECSILDQVLWVARYMDILDVPKELCPDPAAWSLLVACRESPQFRSDFWTRMYAKAIPSRIKESSEFSGDNFDGKEEVDLCEVLLASAQSDEEEDE